VRRASGAKTIPEYSNHTKGLAMDTCQKMMRYDLGYQEPKRLEGKISGSTIG
jgi:hypothetical protein